MVRYIIAVIMTATICNAQTVRIYSSNNWQVVQSLDPATAYQAGEVRIPLSVAPDCPSRYWLPFNGTNIPEMSADQKSATDAAISSNAAYQASLPQQFTHGIEASVLVLTQPNGVGWGIVVDDGDLITYQDHSSPRPAIDVINQRIREAKQARAQLRSELIEVKTNVAAIDPAVFTGSQKAVVSDLKKQLQALRKVVSSLVKDNN